MRDLFYCLSSSSFGHLGFVLAEILLLMLNFEEFFKEWNKVIYPCMFTSLSFSSGFVFPFPLCFSITEVFWVFFCF